VKNATVKTDVLVEKSVAVPTVWVNSIDKDDFMTINLTEEAAKEVKKYLEDTEETHLRVGVRGGGCSGFQYDLLVGSDYDEEADSKFSQHGIDIVVDKKSALYLDGTTLDYLNDISQRGFVFNNPNAVKSCGCGSSFQA
jgi:iron-sulfur cluster assembly protein